MVTDERSVVVRCARLQRTEVGASDRHSIADTHHGMSSTSIMNHARFSGKTGDDGVDWMR